MKHTDATRPRLILGCPFPEAAPVLRRYTETTGHTLFLSPGGVRADLAPWKKNIVGPTCSDRISSPEELTAAIEADLDLLVLDVSPWVLDEAPQLPREALDEALDALIQDGVFPDHTWRDAHPPGPDTEHAAIKYGWAIAQAAAWADVAPGKEIIVCVDLATSPTTTAEAAFLEHELRRRTPHLAALALRLPGSHLEPAAEHDAAALQHAPGLPCPAIFHAEEKTTLIASLAPRFIHSDALVWLAAVRVCARREPALFRKLLHRIQENFVFTRGAEPVSVTEEDARALPIVTEDLIEATYLDFWRGRQILFSCRADLLPLIAELPSRYPDDFSAILEEACARQLA